MLSDKKIPFLRGQFDPLIMDEIVKDDWKYLVHPRNISTRLLLESYVEDFLADAERKGKSQAPARLANYLVVKYKPSSAHQYMIQIQTSIRPEFKKDPGWVNTLDKIARYARIAAPPRKATPATPDQVRTLIGDLRSPVEIAIFQQYTTVSRFSESKSKRNADGLPNLNIWSPRFHPRHRLVELHLVTHKAAAKGQRPYSKWIRVNNQAHAELYLRNHGATYWEVMDHIKKHFPTLSTYSLRRGAIQRLQDLGYQPNEIRLHSGHNKLTKIPTMNSSYAKAVPTDKQVYLASRMCADLSNEILPSRFRSRC